MREELLTPKAPAVKRARRAPAGASGIRALLAGAAETLRGVADAPRAEAELMLAHAMGLDRAGLLAASDSELTGAARKAFQRLVARRARGEPMAYVLGRKEFWSLPLTVTSAVLIPRPETELLVEWALSFPRSLPSSAVVGGRESSFSVLDLGTGSGAIALALARECPRARITATDVSSEALEVARRNAVDLGIRNVTFSESDFARTLARRERFDLIVSNPPYVAEGDPHLEELRYEPEVALTGGPDGLRDLRTIVAAASARLKPGGWLLVEHGAEQGAAVRALFTAAGLSHVETRRDLAGHERATGGQRG